MIDAIAGVLARFRPGAPPGASMFVYPPPHTRSSTFGRPGMARAPLLRLFTVLLLTIALLALLTASPTAHAQEVDDDRDYVDVGVVLEGRDQISSSLDQIVYIVVVNNGFRAAYDVNVVVDVVRPDKSHIIEVPDVPLGSASLERNPGSMTDNTRLRWTLPVLGGLQREVISITVRHRTPENVMPAYNNVLSVHEYAAEVTTTSFESYLHKGNNTSRMWNYNYSHASNKTSRIQVAVEYAVALSVDQENPAPGDIVNFTITASMEQKYGRIGQPPVVPADPPPIDLKVDIELTDGLAVTGTPIYSPRLSTASAAYANGVFDIGTGEADKIVTSDYVVLPVHVASDAVVSEQCLTATLTGNPPPGTGPLDDDIADNVAKLCLGAPPMPIVFASGQSDLLTLFPCVGVTTYPCDTSNSVELAVDSGTAAVKAGYPDAVFQPDNVVIQIEDPVGRAVSGGDILWRTGNAVDHTPAGLGILPGVAAKLVVPIAADGYRKHNFAIADATPGPDSNPGSVRWFLAVNDFTVLHTGTTTSFTHNGLPSSEYDTVFAFNALGTYLVNLTFGAEHTASEVGYTDTETYTFHVGPMADLEVRDGGASPYVDADRNALAIVAANNGPETELDAQVTGLPTGAEVVHVSHGAYNSTTGEWDIGELKGRSVYRSLGEPEPTLVLSASAGDTASVSIASTENYEVCIGSDGADVDAASESACTATTGNTWHTTVYYDHNPGNNTATVTAVAGIAEGHPSAPASLTVMETLLVNIVQWALVDEVNDLQVTHYEVERWANPWTPLADNVPGTAYLDFPGPSNADYRVRAVNAAGVPGPWSITGRPPEPPGNFRAELSDSGNAAVLTWTEPASPSPITGYVIDISDTADGDSRTDDRTVSGSVTTWTDTGLGAGDVKFYRVQARNRDGVGAWTDWQSVGTGPGAPGSLRARANGPSEIVLTWNAASSRDVAVYQYEIEYSDTSASEGYVWLALTAVEGLRHVDESLTPGDTRYYRVRATTLDAQSGNGTWSNVASATTSEAGPAPPSGVFAEADGENRILVTWDASEDTGSYNIEHSTDGATWASERTRHTGTCNVSGQMVPCYTDSGLLSGTTHYYRVAGVNRSGVAGDWSVSVSAITDGEPTEPPWEPENLRITGVSGRQVSLSWGVPQDNGGSRVTGYEYMVEGACVHDPAQICQVVEPRRKGGTSATVTVPNVKGRYEFYVRALNAAGAGWWTQPVGTYVDPQRTWRVTLSPSSLRVDEGGAATYRVRLSSNPRQPVMVALDWQGDPDLGNGDPELGNALSNQQFKWLLPSNYANTNPDIYLDPDYTAAWNVGVSITVTADEDADSDNGTLEIHNTVYYVPCADLGNPAGCVDDPEDTGVNAYITVTERDND